jgi:hypothetical protein
MPAAEIAAVITGIRSALDVTNAMVGLRHAEAFRASPSIKGHPAHCERPVEPPD